MMEATLCFPLRDTRPRQVLLGWKKVGFGAGKYNGFGGKVKAGEGIVAAASRELYEEAGLIASPKDLQPMAHLTFIFPARPEWDQIVHAFLLTAWRGEPRESREMRPVWFAIDALPLDQMWQDDAYWLPRVLAGERLRARFTFGADNETVVKAGIETL